LKLTLIQHELHYSILLARNLPVFFPTFSIASPDKLAYDPYLPAAP